MYSTPSLDSDDVTVYGQIKGICVKLAIYTNQLYVPVPLHHTVYIRDHGGLGLSGQKHHLKTNLAIPFWHLGSIGYKPKSVFSMTLNASIIAKF